MTTVAKDVRGDTVLQSVAYESLSGWPQDRHSAALRAFLRTCARLSATGDDLYAPAHTVSRSRMAEICTRAGALGADPGDAAARIFFETEFEPRAVIDGGDAEGLFTGYFEPRYAGSRSRSIEYSVPIYRRPADLVRQDAQYGRLENGTLQPYLTRREIETGALAGQGLELVYLRSAVDAFFVHIQGSARIALAEGGEMKISFAAKNGQEYEAIGGVLIDRGAIAREDISMQSIRAWLEANPEQAFEVMWRNPSFIFFLESESGEPGVGPPGAAGAGLTAGRSLAVDRSLYSYGLPMWLETTLPSADGASVSVFNRLMIAQDTGSAIRGSIRGDVFVGTGDEAGEIAGRMKQDGRLFVLLPRTVPVSADQPENAALPSQDEDLK